MHDGRTALCGTSPTPLILLPAAHAAATCLVWRRGVQREAPLAELPLAGSPLGHLRRHPGRRDRLTRWRTILFLWGKRLPHLHRRPCRSSIHPTLHHAQVYSGLHGRTIIFTQTKGEANSLALDALIKHDAQVLHGDIAQSQREITLQNFRDGKCKCLVATDVAAR